MASLQRNLGGQLATFALVTTGGAADTTGSGMVGKIALDGTQSGTSGTFTHMGSGQWKYAFTQGETNAANVGLYITATGDVPINMDFHTDPTFFNVLNLDSNGNIGVTSTFKKNVSRNGFMFPMTDSVTHQLKAGIVFNAAGSTRCQDGGASAQTSNVPTEVGGGIYVINFTSTDLNANNIIFTFVMAGTDPTIIEIPTQP